ncbi:PhzF family phenazine biosynthesis protein, partial [Sulfitobacter sp. 1A13679]
TYARLLLAPPSPAEDPFTGSATGAMAAYLWARGLIESPAFVAEQGHLMGRPGRAEVEVLGPRDATTGVRVAGQGRVVMSGQVFMPEVA